MIENAIPIIIGWVIMSVLYGASVALIVRRWRQDISKYKNEINELKELIGELGDHSPTFPDSEE